MSVNSATTPKPYFAIWALPAAMLLIALLPLPYGYYTLLRIIVCLTAAYIALTDYLRTEKLSIWSIIFGVVAILFNPLIPIHLDRSIWFFVDIIAAGLFGIHYFKSNKT